MNVGESATESIIDYKTPLVGACSIRNRGAKFGHDLVACCYSDILVLRWAEIQKSDSESKESGQSRLTRDKASIERKESL